jgi:hypothetical protein
VQRSRRARHSSALVPRTSRECLVRRSGDAFFANVKNSRHGTGGFLLTVVQTDHRSQRLH